MFTKVNSVIVKNEDGIIVDYSERYFIRYKDGDKTLDIPVEGLVHNDPTKPTDIVYLDRLKVWTSSPNETLTEEQKNEIKRNITSALLVIDCKVEYSA